MHRKIVLIDDSLDNAARCREALAAIPDFVYSVFHALSASEGLALIERERPHCTLISWSIGGGGAAVLHRVLSRRPNMPVVMLTEATEQSFQLEELRSVGECEVVNANAAPQLLHRAIEAAINRAESRELSARVASDVRTILIIDDNPDDREFCARALADAEERYQVLEAAGGATGLSLIAEHTPDCVLLDYSLPGLSGMEVLRRIQAIDPFLPVIMMTGQGNEATAVTALRSGAQNYLTKASLTPAHLHRAVLTAIEHAELERQITNQRQEIYEQKLALAESSRLTMAILDNAPCLICATDMEGNVLVFNKELERLLGYRADEIIGKQKPSLWSPRSPIIDRAKVVTERQAAADAAGKTLPPPALPERASAIERTFIRKDGSEVPVLLWVRELYNSEGHPVAMLGLGEDITERKRRDDALKTSEETFRSAMEHAPLGMALMEPEGRFLKVNRALCEMVGCDHVKLNTTTLQALSHPEDRQATDDLMRQLLAGEFPSRSVETRLLNGAGEAVDVQLNLSLVRGSDGKPRYFVAQIQDIRERKEIERLKGEFIAVFRHELRTPLTSIRGSLGLLANPKVHEHPSQAGRLLSIAQRNCDRLTLLINNILDVEGLSTGEGRFEMRPAKLAALLQEAVEINRSYADTFAVTIALDLPEVDVIVSVDPARLLQVLANLLSNAAKFSPPGGEVRVFATLEGEQVRISVADKGPGVPEEFRSRLFQKFSQADTSTTRAVGGSGLGLYISKQVMERMGGAIGAETEEGQGATFWITLPVLELAQDAGEGIEAEAPPLPPAASGTGA